MTYEFFTGQLRLASIALISWLAGRGYLNTVDANAAHQILDPLGALALPVLWSWIANWQKKHMPADAVAIKVDASEVRNPKTLPEGTSVSGVIVKTLLAALFMPMFLSAAIAADSFPVKAVMPIANPCTVTPLSCSGWYVGGGLGGSGTNMDIIGQGLQGSVFAGGGIPFVDAGYQYVNGNWFFGAEVGGGYAFSGNRNLVAGQPIGGTDGYMFYELVKAGGNLSSLFGGVPPFAVSPDLASHVLGLYFTTGGVQRPFSSRGWANGAGIEYDVSTSLFLDFKYLNVNYSDNSGAVKIGSENLLLFSVNKKF